MQELVTNFKPLLPAPREINLERSRGLRETQFLFHYFRYFEVHENMHTPIAVTKTLKRWEGQHAEWKERAANALVAVRKLYHVAVVATTFLIASSPTALRRDPPQHQFGVISHRPWHLRSSATRKIAFNHLHFNTILCNDNALL